MKIAQFAVSLRDGRVHSQGPTNLVLSNEVYISQEIAKQQQVVQPETNKENGPATTADGHLVLEEEKSEGRVSFTSFRIFLDLVGGSVPTVFWALYLFGAVGALAALTLEPWCVLPCLSIRCVVLRPSQVARNMGQPILQSVIHQGECHLVSTIIKLVPKLTIPPAILLYTPR
jgi:hypothetical protein